MGEDSETATQTAAAERTRSGSADGRSTTDPAARDGGRVSRRRILRTAGSVGVALGLTRILGVDRFLAPPDGTVTIETALVHPEPEEGGVDPADLEARTRTVPADWHARVAAALDIHAQVLRTRFPGYLNSAVVPGSYDDGTARLSIGVRASDFEHAPRTLEGLLMHLDVEWRGLLDGVSVRVEETDPPADPQGSNGPEDEYLALDAVTDRVPGGVRCETGRSVATLSPALYHPDRPRPLFGTALHAFEAHESIRGTSITLPTAEGGASQAIGYVLEPLPDSDVAVAAPARGTTPGSAIGRRGEVPIRGQLTRWGLADRVARDVDLMKIGGTSGRTSGRARGLDAATCITTDRCRRGQLTWGNESVIDDGDSGSVAVDPDPDEADGALVASINSARTWWPGQNHVWGVTADRLRRTHGYHF